MPTPPKPCSVIKMEGKSHRTKAELNQREKGEKSLASGKAFKERKEVNENKVAHAEFLRINRLMEGIGKNDALYEPVINRYCMLQAECKDMEGQREEFYEMIHELKRTFHEAAEGMEPGKKTQLLLEFTAQIAKMTASMVNLDKQIQAKRKMLLDIEKENIMTVASALRSIPKKVEDKKNPLLEALGN